MDEHYKVKKESEKYDYALLKLEKIIERPHYPQLSVDFKDKFKNVSVKGFAKDLFILLEHSGELILANTGGLYEIDTYLGQSGSPVILEDDYNLIVGVHKGYDPRAKKNACCLISTEMVSELNIWAKEFKLEDVFFHTDKALKNSEEAHQ